MQIREGCRWKSRASY